ncbi:MAG: STAS/SEC14 domain-containing protein [Methanomicrobiaceae archaeon]|nr:STAS/SEC14 domain-containing protein [Methanomicrobiaceae archaeon]
MLKVLERSHGNIVGIEASGEVTEEDIREITPQLDELIEKYGKISWIYVIKTTKYKTVRAMYEDMMWLLKNIKNFDRMAIVGETKSEELLIKIDGLVFGEKYFDISEIDQAWDYIEGAETRL